MRIMVSACLLGEKCKYNGADNFCQAGSALAQELELIPVCPELAGGLPVPRLPCEIVGGTVMNSAGENVDKAFRAGAAECVRLAKEKEIDLAILQPRSPSCGVHEIYDGTFSGRRIAGSGVFASLLRESGFRIMDADEWKQI